MTIKILENEGIFTFYKVIDDNKSIIVGNYANKVYNYLQNYDNFPGFQIYQFNKFKPMIKEVISQYGKIWKDTLTLSELDGKIQTISKVDVITPEKQSSTPDKSKSDNDMDTAKEVG